ncbi:MAG: hypothetical protein KDC33_11435, partial [Thermoleophilia bacterium]|nr:hypothetical protein [Thermoleophilia bacterium]
RLAAAFAATRARGLVLGHGTVATGAPVPAYAVSSVLAAGPPHELGRALRAVVARPASVSATPGDRALARAVMAAVAAPSDAGRRRVLARRERQAGATPPPIASGAPVTIVFRLP